MFQEGVHRIEGGVASGQWPELGGQGVREGRWKEMRLSARAFNANQGSPLGRTFPAMKEG